MGTATQKKKKAWEIIDHGVTPRSYEKDMGKVHALLDAGWSKAKIAGEFHVCATTVANWLKKEEAT